MWLSGILRIVGILLMLFSLSMLPPALIAWYEDDGLLPFFLDAFSVLLLLGLAVWAPNDRQTRPLRPRDGFLITVLVYVVLAMAGALPIYLSGHVSLWVDAFFESLSGLTTTGATVLSGLDEMPKSLLFYRQELQWLGGMGIVILAVALLPMLGIGGVQLYRAETPTPDKGARLKPRIAETARTLWTIYLVLTVVCALAYAMAGMSWFDAICHSFSTVAVGGFSTYDASIGHFDSRLIEFIASFFLIICAVNFGLHFTAWERRTLRPYFQNGELKFFIGILIFGVLITFVVLRQAIQHPEAWHHAFFQTISIVTTAGFTVATVDAVPLGEWPQYGLVLIFMLALIGGCAGSASGGIKCIRMLVVLRQFIRETSRLIHPNAIYHVKVGHHVVMDKTLHTIWGFLTATLLIVVLMTPIIMSQGFDLMTAFSAVIANFANLGPAVGGFAGGYSEASPLVKWMLCLAMLMGRLEIYAVLMLMTPAFWRR